MLIACYYIFVPYKQMKTVFSLVCTMFRYAVCMKSLFCFVWKLISCLAFFPWRTTAVVTFLNSLLWGTSYIHVVNFNGKRNQYPKPILHRCIQVSPAIKFRHILHNLSEFLTNQRLFLSCPSGEMAWVHVSVKKLYKSSNSVQLQTTLLM